MRTQLDAAFEALQQALESARDGAGRATAESFADAVPRLDVALRDAYHDADACKRVVLLEQPPAVGRYDPAALLRERFGQFMPGERTPGPGKPMACSGDVNQVHACLKMLLETALDDAHYVVTELYANQGMPYITVTVDEDTTLPTALRLGERFAVSMEAFSGWWSRATQGGAADAGLHDILLYLAGDEPVPKGSVAMSALMEPLDGLVRTLQPWRAAIGLHEDGLVAPEEGARLYAQRIGHALDHLAVARDRFNKLVQ